MSDRTVPNAPANVESYFATLAASSGPALVWYAPGGERIELSGRVLENWVAKSANLLSEELDVEPGASLRLEGGPHWRSVALALGALRAGCRLTPREEGPDLWAGFEHDAAAEAAGTALLLARGALAMSYDGAGGLPGDAVDFVREIRAQGDVFLPFEQLPPGLEVAAAEDDAAAGLTLRRWLDLVGEHAGAAGGRAGGAAFVVGDEVLGAQDLARYAGVMLAGAPSC
ncbi:TIGR03089 family protein [Rothia sp. AR01]|uniref:TIGR03089 family protein n=1 Tax=Rothia santali TaxID=2949643 RepID=A0A9X2HCU4_9MICC|nr:TIGR03089 family protein [Rothia santali]MCP3427011.1 TIGR03089 family protein [Rothia santali]